MTVVLSRDNTGKLGILSAPPIFLCTRESIEDMVKRHNELLAERDALKVAGVEIIEAARRSMPRKHGTVERNAKLFIPENVEPCRRRSRSVVGSKLGG